MHLQNTGLDIGTFTAAIWQQWFEAGLFLISSIWRRTLSSCPTLLILFIMEQPTNQTPNQPILAEGTPAAKEKNKIERLQLSGVEADTKKLFSNIPTLTVIIIILGIIKQILYYLNFNLPIKYFLGIAEIGLIVSDDLLFVIAFIIGFSIYHMVMFSPEYFQERLGLMRKAQDANRRKFTSDEKYNKHIEKLERRNNIIMFILYLTIVFSLYFLLRPSHWSYGTFMIAFALWLFITFNLLPRKYEVRLFPNYGGYLTYGVMILCFIVFKTGYDIDNVEHGKYKNTIIKTDDTAYISSDTSYFIGKTEKYAFVYNKHDSSTSIIPTETIKTIKIKESSVKGSFDKMEKK